MTLAEYIDLGHGTRKELAARSGVSEQTIKAVARGMKLKLYDKAKAISDATRPAPFTSKQTPLVSVAELCE